MDGDVLAALLGAGGSLLGASVGAAIGIWHSKTANKERRTMDLFESYQNEVFPKQGTARAVLSFGEKPDKLSKDALDDTRFVGNWYDVYAALALERGLSSSLRKRLGIDNSVRRFWYMYCRSRFREVVKPDEWPNIQQFVEGVELGRFKLRK